MPEIDLTVFYRTLEGDEKSAVEFVRRLTPPLRRVAKRLLDHNQDEVDDLLQATFVRIWRSGRTFDAEQGVPLTVWAVTIMRNVHRDNLRKEQRQPRPFSLDSDSPGADSAGSQQSDADRALSDAVRAALLKLDLQKRTLVWLVDGEGWTLRDAAIFVGLSKETDGNKARGHLRRGRKKLRELLGPAGPPPGPSPPQQHQVLKPSVELRTEAQ